ncbi:hypothetical protein [Facklamia sp. P12955]|uniref:hypothetical protein n=1 Tax=Facklamia sp. P12955 TaxID=3421946 RepID=UPI003D16381B
MKKLNLIEKELTEMIQKRDRDIEEYKERIEQVKNQIDQANKKIEEARVNVDIELNKEGQTELWEAKHTLELYQKNLDELQNKPLISKEEYSSYSKKIKSLATEEDKELELSLTDALKELKKVANQSLANNKKAQELIDVLTVDICKVNEMKHPYNLTSNGSVDLSKSRYNFNHEIIGAYSQIENLPLVKRLDI